MRIPPVGALHEYYPPLAKMVARTSSLPNRETVTQLGRAVFPTSRRKRERPLLSCIEENGVRIGMHDDNVTPEWAIFWAHGLVGTRAKGWTTSILAVGRAS